MKYNIGDILVKSTGDIFTITSVNSKTIHVTWGKGKTGYFARHSIDEYISDGVYSIKHKETLPEELFTL